MASFNVSSHWGEWLAKQGFKVEHNKEFVEHNTRKQAAKQRPMRLFAPESIKGNAAKKWFNKIFWRCHRRVMGDCGCCERVFAKF